MKILHINNFAFKKSGAEFYNTDRKISAGLVLNGHHVYDFSFHDMAYYGTVWRTKKIGKKWANEEVIKIVENFEPDLILIGHSSLLNCETLKTIKSVYPQTKIAFWYVDWICVEKKANFIKEWSPYLDTIFVTTSGELLKTLGHGNTVAYMPNMSLDTIDSLKNFEKNEFENELVFCGSSSDQERTKFIRSLQAKIKHIPARYCGFDQDPKVFGAGYFKVLSQSRMGLNYSRANSLDLYTSDRITQLTGNGLLTFTPRIPGFETLFSDKEVVYFSHVDELADQINYFAHHPAEAQEVAKAGWSRTHSSYNSKRVTKFMLETIFKQPYTEDYEWKAHVFNC
ncbi:MULTISPECIES: glycosyltransferase [unclassified Acinetobacter]|uniref:glycosyltransferase family protein n=1 Tax=unclassified Acinetobacter TaxID=196816 RepID=UPI0015D0FC73|nr:MULTISPECIES: glycosyltransferase [unclassified Acinetobacter]